MFQYPLTVDGVTTRILEGRRDGEPLMLVHGIGARADRWHTTVETLAVEGYRTIAFDLPGHGFATKSPDLPYSVPYFADYLLRVMTELGVDQAHLIGTSLGGHVVAEAACQSPNRVENIVMVGAIGLVDNAELTHRIGTGMITDDGSVESVRTRLARVCGRPELVTEDWVYEEWRFSQAVKDIRPVLGRYMRDRVERDVVTSRLNQVTGELGILLIWGEDEASVPLDVGQRSLNALPRAALQTIAGGGHGIYYEQPDAFNRVVIDFLRK